MAQPEDAAAQALRFAAHALQHISLNSSSSSSSDEEHDAAESAHLAAAAMSRRRWPVRSSRTSCSAALHM
jgi:hypothetical protein